MLSLLAILMSTHVVTGGANPPTLASSGKATGFFHTQRLADHWWLIDPRGKRFLSLGVNGIRYDGDAIRATDRHPYREACEAKYGSREVWAAAALKFLRGLGVNTIGAWSGDYLWDRGVPYTVILNIAARSGGNWLTGQAADMWSPRFEQTAQEVARDVCGPRRNKPQLLGYFLDNELHWGPDWRIATTLIEEYLMLPADAPGHARAVDLLRTRYRTIDDLNAAWGLSLKDWSDFDRSVHFKGPDRTKAAWADAAAFVKLAARRYFEVCHDAIRRHDPNHLILGCREAIATAAQPLAEGARGLVDVFSLSYYTPRAYVPPLRALHEASRAPILVSEWAFRSRDSGLPNTKGAGPLVDTQADRAAKYREYMTELLEQPYVVGAHWFEYTDEPAEGRFDGENSNYGLVNIHDEPYEVFTAMLKQVNAEAYQLHARN
jgi:agarase